MSEEAQRNTVSGAKLRSCNLCGRDISPYSVFCRNCGHPQKTPLIIWLLVAFLFLMIAFYLAMTLFCMCNVQDLRVRGKPAEPQSMSPPPTHLEPVPLART